MLNLIPVVDKKMLTCDLCNRELPSAIKLTHHMEKHFDMKQFSCAECKKSFTSRLELRKHNVKIHTATATFRCDTCNFKAFNSKVIECHVLGHYNVETETGIICNICNQEFGSKFQLKIHLRVHINDPNFYCAACDKRFTTTSELKKHAKYNKDVHTQLHRQRFEFKAVPCKRCDGIFYSSAQLALHRCSKVLAERLQCSVCNKKLTSMYLLRIHLNIHTGEKPYKCATCNMGFYDPTTRKDHTYLHSEARHFICELCGAAFKQRVGLKTHKKKHALSRANLIGTGTNVDNHRCKICGKFFSRLEIHMRTHTGERPYKCDKCGKSFSQHGTLTNHRLVHSAVKFICKYCFKVLKHPTSLRIHERKHTKEGMRKCGICGNEFTCTSTLLRHMETHSEHKTVCHICGKSLSSLSIHQHLKTHDPEQIFRCKICEQVLKSKRSLSDHMNTHNASSAFLCGYPFCSKGYKSKSLLLNHVRKTHKKIPST